MCRQRKPENRKDETLQFAYFGGVPGELLFRVTTGHVTLLPPKRPADAAPMFILSMSLISKAFAPDSIFGRDSLAVAFQEQIGADPRVKLLRNFRHDSLSKQAISKLFFSALAA